MSATSKLTAQAQVSVPASVRRKLGLGPGSILAWETEGDRVVVRRVGTHSSQEIHEKVFSRKPKKKKTLAQIKQGLKAHVRKRHARD